MNKEYVKQYVQLEKAHWWFVVRQKIILYFLRKNITGHSLKILNVGAAGGASSKWLEEFGEVTSLETDPVFLEHLHDNGMNVLNASVIDMPFTDNSFDLVCAFDVIEHVENDTLALEEINRVCKEEGTICITVPAFSSLWGNHDVVNVHFRRYTKKSFFSKLKSVPSAQFKSQEITYFNTILFLPIFIARKISSIVPFRNKKEQSDFTLYKTPGWLNEFLKSVFSFELPLLRKFYFPFGVSLLFVLKKKGKDTR